MRKKISLAALCMVALFLVGTLQAQQVSDYPSHSSTQSGAYATTYQSYPMISDAEIRQRLSSFSNQVITPRFTSAVRSYISTYTVKKRDKTEAMLGKIPIYFPMFEQYLQKHNMPTDMKYLAVVESALNPRATSRAGAHGLWQFMPATGKEFGLNITSYIDERGDPHKSTEAACQFLKRLHRRYGDWALALAAYNSGPGRVNRAIKRARSKNFWKLQKYLPRETRNYVPAFIAAAYVVHYHESHHLVPRTFDYEMQVTETTKVYDQITFEEISRISGTSIEVIQALNPAYKRNIIPASRRGHYLILPYHRIGTFVRHQMGIEAPVAARDNFIPQEQANADITFRTVETEYQVQSGDNLTSIAKAFRCKPENIKVWNKMTSSHIRPGQKLIIMERVRTLRTPRHNVYLDELDYIRASSVASTEIIPENIGFHLPSNSTAEAGKESAYIYYSVRRGESLKDISKKFKNVTIDEIMKDNAIESPKQVKSGTVLLVRQ